ncbi:MAG: polysaccharide deacetylase family protein [Chitinispirillales bacterium]|jgi:polysaccharide deacetylase family protein (PEP-CTERM system associated)|nr:polysaccharide deacetylase family protein [Chitinispirillales bacterium]
MNILTFDIEEWFHILDNESTKTAKEWQCYEPRIHDNMERIFGILDETGVKATFFCLGWIAEKYPDVIKTIADKGYEIGTHTHMHQLIYEQHPNVFANDMERSIKTLEDISGKKVRCFRAPGFSLCRDNLWVFDILVNLGITIDSSVFAAPRMHGGFSDYSCNAPAFIQYNGIRLKEFPVNRAKLAGKSFVYSGGGYFRLFPYFCIKSWARKSPYIMAYMHPRDFDAKQPVFKDLPLSRKFKSYIGLSGAHKKLKKFLNDFEFTDIDGADKIIDWENARVITV